MPAFKIILLIFTFNLHAEASTAIVPLKDSSFQLAAQSTVSMQVPAGWETAEGLFGIPLTLLGPEVSGTRPTVAIQPTEKTGGLDPKEMKADQAGYQAGREAWVKKQDGKVLKFIPYAFEKTSSAELHRMGVEYQISGIHFTEWSIHLFCKQKLFFVKAIFEAKHPVSDQKAAETAIRSFKCD